jgi:hypothetical protein
MKGMGGGAMNLLKAGAIGAAGALVVDVGMGFLNGFLPVSMNTKLNGDGTPNYMNYAVKGALAVGLASFGGKLVQAETAKRMAAGSMTVMVYELTRPFAQSILPGTMSLGWYSPGRIMAPARGVGAYLGKYSTVAPIRSPNAVGAATGGRR